MEATRDWKPTKYVVSGNGLRASRDIDEVAAGSRLMADRISGFYTDAIPRFARGALLDLGCGKAPLYGLYRPHVKTVTWADWLNTLHHNSKLDLVQDLNGPLALTSGSFDTVILSDVLEHVRDPGGLLGEISRILVPGGTLIANVPFMYWLHEQPYDYYRFTRYGLEYLASSAGLEVVDLSSIGGLPEVLADLLSKPAAQVPVAGVPFAGLIQFLVSRSFRRNGVCWKVSHRTKDLFPLGYAMILRKNSSDELTDSPSRIDWSMPPT